VLTGLDQPEAERLLHVRANAGDEAATRTLASVLAERGDLEELRARANADDGYAARELADLLAGRGDLDEAERLLRVRADADDDYATRELTRLLVGRGDIDEAIQECTPVAVALTVAQWDRSPVDRLDHSPGTLAPRLEGCRGLGSSAWGLVRLGL
jgi:hypothetical protein